MMLNSESNSSGEVSTSGQAAATSSNSGQIRASEMLEDMVHLSLGNVAAAAAAAAAATSVSSSGKDISEPYFEPFLIFFYDFRKH